MRDIEAVPPEEFARNLRRAEHKFELMGRLGADTVLVCSSVSPLAVDDDALAAAQLRRLADLAQEFGIRVAYEALAWGRHVSTYDHAWRIVEAADHPALGTCLDSFHILARGSDPKGIEDIPGEKIFFLQLADAPLMAMDVLQWSRHYRCFPGQGGFDVAGLARARDARRIPGAALARGLQRRLPAGGGRTDRRRRPALPARTPGGDRSRRAARTRRPHRRRLRRTRHPRRRAGLRAPRRARLRPHGQAPQQAGRPVAAGRGPRPGQHGSGRPARRHRARRHRPGVPGPGRRGPARRVPPRPRTAAPPRPRGRPAGRGGRTRRHRTLLLRDGPGRCPNWPNPGWTGDFEPRRSTRRPRGGVHRIDHLALTQPWHQFDEAALFHRSVLGLERAGERRRRRPVRPAPQPRRHQRRRQRADRPRRRTRPPPTTAAAPSTSPSPPTTWSPPPAASGTPAAACCRCPPNYYDDLAARFEFADGELETYRELGILYDRDADGEFRHCYTETVGRVFFELVQRDGGYRGYGAQNAPVRLAAQHARRPVR